jgi:hypothetical protein
MRNGDNLVDGDDVTREGGDDDDVAGDDNVARDDDSDVNILSSTRPLDNHSQPHYGQKFVLFGIN